MTITILQVAMILAPAFTVSMNFKFFLAVLELTIYIDVELSCNKELTDAR